MSLNKNGINVFTGIFTGDGSLQNSSTLIDTRFQQS